MSANLWGGFAAPIRYGLAALVFLSSIGVLPGKAGQTPAPQTPAQAPGSSPQGDGQQQLPTEFLSHGIEYETLTRNGITVMFAPLPPHVKEFSIVQVTVTNGSLVSWTVKPSDFSFVRQNGVSLVSSSADEVVSSLLERASGNDVIKLQLLYEETIYGLANFRSTSGYEQRRQAGMTQFVNRGFKAAAAASAITLVPVKLKPGDSTDGAVFFENRTREKALGSGRFTAKTCGETFVFDVYGEKLH